MARMVFGQMVEGYAPPRAEHFVARKLRGEKTACGRPFTGRIRTWKDWKMVTCQQCLAHRPQGGK